MYIIFKEDERKNPAETFRFATDCPGYFKKALKNSLILNGITHLNFPLFSKWKMLKRLQHQQASDSDAYCTLSTLLCACIKNRTRKRAEKLYHCRMLKRNREPLNEFPVSKRELNFIQRLLALDGAVANFMNASKFNMQRYGIACNAYKVISSLNWFESPTLYTRRVSMLNVCICTQSWFCTWFHFIAPKNPFNLVGGT